MKVSVTRSHLRLTMAGIAMMTAVLVLVTGTSDAARGARGGGARAGGYAYRGAVHGGAVAGTRAYAYGQSPTYRSWSSGHYYGGGNPYGGWHGYHYHAPYGYYAPHAYVGFGIGVPYYAPVYGYPVYYPVPVATPPDATVPPGDQPTPESGTPSASVETPEPALVDSTTSFDVTNDPPPGCYYYDRFCKRKFANLDDYTDHLQGQSHPATIEIMEKDGTGMLTLEFVGGVWKVRH